MKHRKGLLTGILPALALGAVPVQAGYISGTDPSQRPPGAPTITQVQHDKAWYDRALTGVVPPYPASLRFLDDEGNWYTPFNEPGMTGRYDIRGWYKRR